MLFEEQAIVSLHNHVNSLEDRYRQRCLNCFRHQALHQGDLRLNNHHQVRSNAAAYFHMPASGSLLDDYGHAHSKFEIDYAKALDEEQ